MNLPSRLCTLLACASVLSAQDTFGADTKTVASYLQAHADELVGKAVSIDVTHVAKMKTPVRAAAFAFFKAFTYDKKNRKKGGTITVVVAKDEADRLLRQYGAAPKLTIGAKRRADTRVLRGILGRTKKDQLCVCKSQEIYDHLPGLQKPAPKEAGEKTARPPAN